MMNLRLIDRDAPFEKRLLQAVSLYLFGLSCIVTFVDVSSDYRLGVLAVHCYLIFSSIVIFILSKTAISYQKLKLPLLFTLYSGITLYWFLSTGINGATGIGLVSVMTISFLFSRPENRKLTFSFNLLFLLLLSAGHYFFSEWMIFGFLFYEGIIIEYVVVGIGQLVLLFLLKREVDSERRIIRLKNDQLMHLNQSLKSTVASQFRTLKELTSTQNKLLESERMASIGKLTAGLAHELNNPLNFVGGVVGPIKKDIEELRGLIPYEQREQAEFISQELSVLLDSVESGTARASQVVRQLMNVTPKGDSPSEYRQFDFSELIRDVARLVEKSNRHIQFDYQLEESVLLQGSEIEMSQVILNLLRNSIQAIPDEVEGQLTIRCERNDFIEFSVSDNGVGMDKEAVDNAFEAFFSTKQEQNGTGLGLFISHGIIEKHKGKIGVESSPGKGTTISITLPVHIEAATSSG